MPVWDEFLLVCLFAILDVKYTRLVPRIPRFIESTRGKGVLIHALRSLPTKKLQSEESGLASHSWRLVGVIAVIV
jgi:hypothetical protein